VLVRHATCALSVLLPVLEAWIVLVAANCCKLRNPEVPVTCHITCYPWPCCSPDLLPLHGGAHCALHQVSCNTSWTAAIRLVRPACPEAHLVLSWCCHAGVQPFQSKLVKCRGLAWARVPAFAVSQQQQLLLQLCTRLRFLAQCSVERTDALTQLLHAARDHHTRAT
jgi:hypothetical protein